MGYGEVGGGGSLQWQITYKHGSVDHDSGSSTKPRKGHGKDTDANQGDALYVVIKRGAVILADANQVIVRVSLANHDDVQLAWGAQALSLTEALDSAVATIDLSNLAVDRSETV